MTILLITTFNRLNFLSRCLDSLRKTVPGRKIFLVDDGSNEDTKEYIKNIDNPDLEMYILNRTNIGLAPSMNIGLDAINHYVRFQVAEGHITEDVWVSYIQDDVEFIEKDWDEICINQYKLTNSTIPRTNIGFITGHVAPEHENSTPKLGVPPKGCMLRNHIRATHMMTTIEEWMRHFPISVYGESGAVRGHPGQGRGSDVDWWLLRGANGTLTRNMTNLVVPNLLKHSGYGSSTWQPGFLPEIELTNNRIENSIRN